MKLLIIDAMGMMINRRRACGGSEKLPQGAVRIEYLESRGGAYINPLIGANNNYVVDCRFRLVNPTVDISPFGFFVFSTTALRVYWKTNGLFYYQYKKAIGSNTNINTKDEWHDVVLGNNKLLFDGSQFDASSAADYQNQQIPFILFGACSNNQRNVELISTATSFIDIAYISISLEGIKVADFIPVRIGQIGYMYDKVSKQLFGNAGTGSFILGPDV